MEKEICVLKNFRNILDSTTDTDCTDLDNAIKTIEYAMKPKTCDGCKFLNGVICKHDRGLYCVRQFEEDYFQPKDNA